MTVFSQQLGGFFAGSVSLADVERAADRVVAEDVDIENAVGLIDMHHEAGRLPVQLHRILHDRLTQSYRSRHSEPATADTPDRLPIGSEPVEPSSIDIDEFTDVAAQFGDGRAGGADRTTPQSDATAPLPASTSGDVGNAELTAPLAGIADATAPVAGVEELTAPIAGIDDATATLPPVDDVTAAIAGIDDSIEALPSAQRAPESVQGAPASHEPTERINSHVAPTVQIHKSTDATQPIVDRTMPIADVPPPGAPGSDKTLPIGQVPAPNQATTDKTLPIGQVAVPGQGTADKTLPLSAVPAPGAATDDTLPIHDGLHPSQRLPTGTGSNWLRPDQWTQRHTGPLGPGVVVKERFLIESQLGRGGMGVVFKARDQRKEEAQDRDPYVAIKVLNDTFREHPQALIALQREARKAQTLAHPNIITVYDFDRDGTRVFMTMELMRGEPMDVVLRRHRDGGLEDEQARSIVTEMAAGLAYAHKLDIIHSDFKPGNVFLTEDNRVKILDFGIARATAYSGGDSGDQTLFDAGDLGSLTPAYASYEMFNKGAPHPADDVYALAITAYMLFTGKHPFDRKTAEQVLELGLEPEPIKSIARHEWQAIAQGLAPQRAERLPDAAAFAAAFRGPQRVSKWISAAIAALAVVAVYFAYANFQDRGPAVDWNDLTQAQRTQFTELVDSGHQWLQNDPPWIGGAYNDFSEAYTIHPRNAEAIEGLDAVARLLIALADDADTTAAKRRLLEDIQTASVNEYLDGHRQLRRTRQRLEQAVNTAQ
ncbi:MAG: protein kinase [Pseudomonadota bacterium]